MLKTLIAVLMGIFMAAPLLAVDGPKLLEQIDMELLMESGALHLLLYHPGLPQVNFVRDGNGLGQF